MSNELNNVLPKDKKKSFIERFFNFASHTMKLNKKTANSNQKKKSSKSNFMKSNSSSLKLKNEEVETCTFCDYCDGEIVATFTGQNIICHDLCNEQHIKDIDVLDYPDIISSSIDSSTFTSSATHETSVKLSDYNRLTTSAIDLPYADDSSLNNSTISTYRFNPRTSISTIRSNFILNSDNDSYTFNTSDLSTIKQFNISIKKMPSFRDKSIDTKKKLTENDIIISKRSDSFDKPDIPDDVTDLIDTFNDNDQGLFIENISNRLMGKVRVFINLLRPIKMLLTARPPSIFDSFPENNDKGETTIQRVYYNKEVIFWLPRGTTNLLYININCTTSELISMLLAKFNIQNNPKKFALYQHKIISPTEVEVCKFKPSQCPLKVMIAWCTKGQEEYQNNLKTKRFVLQENDPGSIEWDDFSIPELQSFLKILSQEEQDKNKQIQRQFAILKSEIDRCMNKLNISH